MKSRPLCLAVLALALALPTHAGVTLARNRTTRYVILQAGDARQPERNAARLLAETLEAVTGATFPIDRATDDAPSRAIVVGPGRVARALFPDVPWDQLGPEEIVKYAKRFGLTGNLQPYYSLALGASEATLIELTSAYAIFPNQGVRMTPYSVIAISDRDGNVLEENRPQAREAIRADTAYVMTNIMTGVVLRGTARCSGKGRASPFAAAKSRRFST